MKETTTNFNIKLPNHQVIEQRIHELFPNYKIKFSAFTGRWEIKDKKFKHFFWYEENKASEFTTKRRIRPKELYILNTLLVGLYVIFRILNKQYNWVEDTFLVFLVWIGLAIFLDFIFYHFKPQHKETLIKEHERVLNLIKSISNTN